jgi:hypothetical protein
MAPATQYEAQRMSLDELTHTVEFAHLSPKMGTFVRIYLQNFLDTGTFDPLSATKTGYDCKSDSSARTFGYQLLSNPKIILCLNRFFGSSPEEAFLRQVEKAIYSRKLTIAQVRALELQCKLNGWENGIPRSRDLHVTGSETDDESQPRAEASPAQKFFVGQLVTQRDGDGVVHTGRVLAIGPDGVPTQIEEVR